MKLNLDEQGLAIRRSVLGDEYVNRALGQINAFNAPLQELVTEYCWGRLWGRPGLDRKQRSLLNLAMIATLNRPHELRAHVRGAINNGLTPTEIGEVFLQVMVYVGVPAAVDSFRIATEVFGEMNISFEPAEIASHPK
jgi:4-carboxymuconolactone decarboxylase